MARPRCSDEARVMTAVRLPASLRRALDEAAAARDVSVNLLVTRAVSQYLEHLSPAEEVLTATERRP